MILRCLCASSREIFCEHVYDETRYKKQNRIWPRIPMNIKIMTLYILLIYRSICMRVSHKGLRNTAAVQLSSRRPAFLILVGLNLLLPHQR